MEKDNLIRLILQQLEKDIQKVDANSYRIVHFSVSESTSKDGCYEADVIVNTDMGIYRFSYCLCENDKSYILCDSQEAKISW